MIKKYTAILLVSIVALASGCSNSDKSRNDDDQNLQEASDVSTQEKEGSNIPWTLDINDLDTTALKVEISETDCEKNKASAIVSWELTSKHGGKPEIWLTSGKKEPKLWISPSKREGSKTTGKWLNNSSAIYLVDSISNKVITRETITLPNCQ